MNISPLADPRDTPAPHRTLRDELRDTEWRLRRALEPHPDYPFNLPFSPGASSGTALVPDINLGNPHAALPGGADFAELERQALHWLMRLWGCEDTADYWGTTCASGTEGNLLGLYLGREALPEAVLLHSAEAHGSIPGAARIQRIPARQVRSTAEGAIDLGDLAETLAGLGGRPVVLALTCGTGAAGAHDDIAGAIAVLEAAGHGPDRRFIHVDAARSGMVLPFLTDGPASIRPGFHLAIDSLSLSGQKAMGTPMPCGVLVCRRTHARRIIRPATDQRAGDTALMGSRNGPAVLAIWTRLFGRGYGAFAEEARRCTHRAQALARQLRGAGAHQVLCNPHSLTVVFPRPDDGIVRTYQLACSGGMARAVVMPSVTEAMLDCFVSDYAAWAARSGGRNDAAMTQPL